VFRITRRGRGSGRAPALSVVRSADGARLEVREGRYGQGALYAYCDVDDTLAAHTLLLTFADMRARVIYIHDSLPLISERKFFDAFGSGSVLPDADSLPDALPDADDSSSLWVSRSMDGELLDVCGFVDV
jgi:hypothetical protein